MYGLTDIATRKVERNLILINKWLPRASFGECGVRLAAVTMRRSAPEPRESVSSTPTLFLS